MKFKETGDLLRCEAKTAFIKRIEIMTKLRSIDVGNYESLELLGYDDEGNVFTTLEGVRFDWLLTENSNLAKFVSFKESKVKTSAFRVELEENQAQSDIVVLQGLRTGEITIKTKIIERGYEVNF